MDVSEILWSGFHHQQVLGRIVHKTNGDSIGRVRWGRARAFRPVDDKSLGLF